MEGILAGVIDWFIQFCININGPAITLLQFKDGSPVLAAINTFWDLLSPFAMTLTIAYFGIDVNKKLVFEGTDVNIKTFGFPFIKLAAALVVIGHGKDIFKAVTDIFNGLLDLSGKFSLADGDFKNLGDLGANIASLVGFWGLIVMLLPLLIGVIVALVCNLVWIYKAFTFKAEFCARYLFAPIAFADVYSGNNSAAIRYIKGTIAFALYGMAMIILPKAVMAIAVDEINSAFANLTSLGEGMNGVLDALSGLFMVMIAPIASIGIVGAAKSITKEAMGV